MTTKELDEMSIDEWCDVYNQMRYALEFDSKRLAGNEKNPARIPL